MSVVSTLAARILSGGAAATRCEALGLVDAALDELTAAADQIRQQRCGADFDLCTIINARSGNCSEDCRFCAQSVHYQTDTDVYSWLPTETIVAAASRQHAAGVRRFSLVSSGRCLPRPDLDRVCAVVRAIRAACPISVCVSLGLNDADAYARLRDAGVSRIHANLEASARFFPSICTTHGFADKLATIRAARSVGLAVCSGGILGLGETWADRIDLALTLRALDIASIPLNRLVPIPGTPLAAQAELPDDDFVRTVALYRFILPDAVIRLAGGRGSLADAGRRCFQSGANAAITGTMLTTAGSAVARDRELVRELGYRVSSGSLEPAAPMSHAKTLIQRLPSA